MGYKDIGTMHGLFVCLYRKESRRALVSFVVVLCWLGVFRGPVGVDCEVRGHLFVGTEHGSFGFR